MSDKLVPNIEEPKQTEQQASLHNQQPAVNPGARRSDELSPYRSFDPPPPGFDPHTAPNEVLLRHGLPRRPHPEREPDIARIWKLIFARPLTYIKAELKLDKVMSERSRGKAKGGADFGPESWIGAILRFGAPFRWVSAEWVIPEVIGNKRWQGGTKIGLWVGMDGFLAEDNQVLQAGVSATLDTNWSWSWWPPFLVRHSVITWNAWTEWYPRASQAIPNFPVKPGDTVSVVVCAPQPGDTATVFFANLSTNHGTSIEVHAPDGYTLQGDSVEWIVEPVSGVPWLLGAPPLLQFNPVAFNSCRAGAPDQFFDLRNAGQMPPDGSVLANVHIERPSLVDPPDPDYQPNSVTVAWIKSAP